MHLCFLDIDGTLLLTGGAGQHAFAETLAADFGIPELDGNVGFSGRSDKAIAMDLFKSHGLEASEETWQRFRAGYLRRLKSALVACKGYVLPGVPQFLQALAARGDVAIGLLTGNMRDGAQCKLTHYELWHWFAFGGYGDEHMERCDIAAAALADARRHLSGRSNGTSSESAVNNWQMIVIGDTPHDIRCGRSIGAHCVAVPTGNFSASELRDSQPDILVDTLENQHPILSLFDRE